MYVICLSEEGLDDVSMDETGNVFARLPGRERREQTADRLRPSGYGLSHRDRPVGQARARADPWARAWEITLWASRRCSVCLVLAGTQSIALRGDIWFVANVCEEGLGDLRGMKAVVDRFGADVHAYLVLEGLALGHVYHRAVGVKRYRVTARTAGGHSWSDYGQPSAIHELAKLVVEIDLA